MHQRTLVSRSKMGTKPQLARSSSTMAIRNFMDEHTSFIAKASTVSAETSPCSGR